MVSLLSSLCLCVSVVNLLYLGITWHARQYGISSSELTTEAQRHRKNEDSYFGSPTRLIGDAHTLLACRY